MKTHENANRNPPRKWGYFSRSPGAFSIVKYNVSSPILHSNIHQVLRLPQKVTLDLHRILPLPRKVTLDLHRILPLPRKVTLELHQILPLPRKVALDLHQVLHLPRKVTRIVHPRDIWTLIYNARSNQCLPPNSPNTAPATQNDHLTCGRNLRKTGETSFPMRGRSENDPRMIRAWSEHDPTMIRPWSDHENANRNPPRKWGYFSRSPGAFSIVKYNVSSPILHSNIHQVLRLPQKVTLDLHRILPLPRKVTLDLHRILPLPRKVTLELHQVLPLTRKVTLDLHQVLHLPRKVTRIVHPRDIWNLIYNARSNQCLPPNSPNTAPATQNDHLTCGRNLRKTGETSFPMRGRSENDPRMIRAWSEHDPTMIRPWKRKPQPASQVRLLFEVPRSIFYCKIQRFEPNLTFKHSPSAAPATKSNTWPSPNTAPTTKSNTWPSPNTAPTTKVTLELHQILPLPRKVTLDLHQVLHLPRKVTFELHLLYYSWL